MGTGKAKHSMRTFVQIDTREAMGRISVFFSDRDATGPYEQWCAKWFKTFEDAECYRQQWALELYEESARRSSSLPFR